MVSGETQVQYVSCRHIDSSEEQEGVGVQSIFNFSSSENLKAMTPAGVQGLAYSRLLPSFLCMGQLPSPVDGLFEVTFKWLRPSCFITACKGRKTVALGLEFLAGGPPGETRWAPDPGSVCRCGTQPPAEPPNAYVSSF